jgi:predicted PurR-regulated permease PerM
VSDSTAQEEGHGAPPATETSVEQVGPPEPPPRVVVPRWVQLVALPLALLALWALARAAGTVLLIFIAAAVIALILNPLVSALQRRRLPRGLAILVVYIAMLALLVIAGILLANPVSGQVERFQRDVPSIIDSANQRLDDLQSYFDDGGIDVKVKTQGESALQTLQEKVIGGTSDIVSFGGDLLRQLVRAGLGLVLIIVLSVYMLIYGQQIGALVRTVMPPGDGTPEDDYPTRAQAAVAGYVRGQFLFSLAMGTGAGLGLYLYGVSGIFPDGRTYAFAFGVFFGFMELVPFVGPVLGAMPPVLVALFQDPLTAVWVGLLFLALQQIEGHIVAPQIFGHTLRINPLFVIFALLFGAEVYGVVGALVALPIAAVTRETVVYLRRHLVLEPWGAVSPLAVAGAEGSVPITPAVACCHRCGAEAGPADAFCRACGASLMPTEAASGR